MNIEDEDVGRLRSVHFPKRKENVNSHDICFTLCHIIRNVAHETTPETDLSDRIQSALIHLGVPKEEFEQLEKEQ